MVGARQSCVVDATIGNGSVIKICIVETPILVQLNRSDICVFDNDSTNGEITKAKACPGAPTEIGAPLLDVPPLRVTLRMGSWIGVDFCGTQVGREATVDEFASDSRSRKEANQYRYSDCFN